MQEQFRRYDRIAGAVVVVLLVVGVITLGVTSKPKAAGQASPLARATPAAHGPTPRGPGYPVMSLVAKLAQAAARNTAT